MVFLSPSQASLPALTTLERKAPGGHGESWNMKIRTLSKGTKPNVTAIDGIPQRRRHRAAMSYMTPRDRWQWPAITQIRAAAHGYARFAGILLDLRWSN
ncbi:hypothetical protein [Stenotrophomonas sp. 169]|jgi:hypothetical protein|uniref:hypothetical protein n=1 Tax=Stenotrophomonas sp. 169 TaxID=2770322 RepID=UPI001CB7712C|nr:hypothetical protein [Stenotrophomonas sp. 169]